jgi:hypothetical protein
MDQQQIDKLRAAGYTDDDIRDYVSNQPQLATGSPTQTQPETLPEIDVTKPSDTLSQAEAAGVPTGARESSFFSDVITAAPVVLAENAGKLAVGAGGVGGLLAANQVRKGMQASANARNAQSAAQMAQAQAAMEQARAAQMQSQGIQQRFEAKQALKPIAPSPILDQYGRAIPTAAQPVAPSAMPTGTAPMAQAPAQPALRGPSMIDKTTSMIRQLAANKVVQGLAKGANVLGGAQMAAYSSELGPKTPQVGRMRGMEINPMTGAPWTPQQIAQYESNPMVFDQQMAPPQMRR